MVIASTDDTDVNIGIYEDAERRAMLVNIVDVPACATSSFRRSCVRGHLPSRSPPRAPLRRWPSASRPRSPTSTASPTPAWRSCSTMYAAGPGHAAHYQDRKAFFESIVNGEPDPVELLRHDDTDAVRDLIAAAQRTHEPRPLRGAVRTSTVARRPDGRRGVQGGDRQACGGERRRPDVPRDHRSSAPRRCTEGGRARNRPPRRDPGRQANRRAGPTLSPAGAVVRGRDGGGETRKGVTLVAEARSTGRRAWRWKR